MPCYRPIPAAIEAPYKRGKDWIRPPPVLHPPLGTANGAIPCGRCVGCLSTRALQWAQRCQHEAASWRDNLFLTLTYDDDNLPANGYLEPEALTRFVKRLRKRVADRASDLRSDPRRSPRLFACGEYGERGGRPHYHLLLFNLGVERPRRIGKDLSTAEVFDRLWPHGNHTFGPATPAAANYIAQYTLKKQRPHPHWGKSVGYEGVGQYWIDADGVEHDTRKPAPFLRMSLRPGIGHDWLQRYKSDLQHGYLVHDGRRSAIPRTYREKLKLSDPALAEDIAIRSAEHTNRNLSHLVKSSHPDSLQAAETIHKRLKTLNTNRRI